MRHDEVEEGGAAAAQLARRQRVPAAARMRHPDRFVHGAPAVSSLPEVVWINPPEDRSQIDPHLASAQLFDSASTMEGLH